MPSETLDERYLAKIRVTVDGLKALGLPLDNALEKYQGETFVDGRPKQPVFAEVLASAISKKTAQYLEKRCGGGAFHFFRGNRTGLEYAVDLILGWLVEDAIMQKLQDENLLPKLSGADRNREFLRNGKISASSDVEIETSHGPRLLEVVDDKTGFWSREDAYDMRFAKYEKLVKEDAILLGLALVEGLAFSVEMAAVDESEIAEIPFHYVYKKPVRRLLNVRGRLRPLAAVLDDLREPPNG